MAELDGQIRELVGRDRSEGDNFLLAALYAERARIAGNNCVVFIMWLLSGDFISSSV